MARPDGRLVREQGLAHERGQFQAHCEPGSPVALETVGNWYWIVDEIEGAGCIPKLVHARKANLMMGKREAYREPQASAVSSTGDKRDFAMSSRKLES